jgi:NitT/TauT family transport system permease protein
VFACVPPQVGMLRLGRLCFAAGRSELLHGGLAETMRTHFMSPPRPVEERLILAPPDAPGTAVAPPVGGRSASRWSRRLAGLRRALVGALPAAAIGLGVLAAWQILAVTGTVNALFLPSPAAVVRSWWYSVISPTNSLVGYAGITLLESVLGCALGAAVAIPLGYLIVRSRLVAGAAQPYVAASQALPAVAIAPLIALWLGYDLTPVVVLCALIVFFPMVITTALGMRMLDREILDAARVEGANRWALLRYIEVPLALPSILAGLRTSLTLSITGAIVGEFVVGGRGLGELLVVYQQSLDSAGVFATLLTLALLAAALYGGMRLVERRFSIVEASSPT